MLLFRHAAAAAAVFACTVGSAGAASVEVGTRPYFVIDQMQSSPLKEKLLSCADRNFSRTDFSIGHRGAPLMYPEHTRESNIAAARMGAGILECDVTFTADKELVCRHAQNDLHTTTNILATDLAAKCTKGFDLAPVIPPALSRICSGYGPVGTGLQTASA